MTPPSPTVAVVRYDTRMKALRGSGEVFRVAKFLTSGIVTAGADLVLLHILVKFARMEEVSASVIAFALSLILNFSLQKFWSFEERDLSRILVQALQFATNGGINLAMNTVQMYLFVHVLSINYLLAQILSLPLIAIESYLAYRFVIFRRTP
ncbi:GtrA family protein [Candidatus Kaiserbacteria bacterium]|nr:GtrA family protein [Candidatus Kaiserbacteria bacterium]